MKGEILTPSAFYVKASLQLTHTSFYALIALQSSSKRHGFSSNVSPDWNLAAAGLRVSSVEVAKKQAISFHFTVFESRTCLWLFEKRSLHVKGALTGQGQQPRVHLYLAGKIEQPCCLHAHGQVKPDDFKGKLKELCLGVPNSNYLSHCDGV